MERTIVVVTDFYFFLSPANSLHCTGSRSVLFKGKECALRESMAFLAVRNERFNNQEDA